MRIYGRNLFRYITVVPSLLLWVGRTIVTTKRPFHILWCYARRISPPFVELRSGPKLFLGSHPHDIITFFVVFIKRDYGAIGQGWNVVDIGANIGLFVVYAALNGAAKVLCFEPNPTAFDLLKRNVEENGVSAIVVAHNMAVGAADGEHLGIPVASSPYNQVSHSDDEEEPGEHITVDSSSLPTMLAMQGIDRVDLLKMDREGSEYQIVPSLPAAMLDRIAHIRMECHGSQQKLIDDLWLDNLAAASQETRLG